MEFLRRFWIKGIFEELKSFYESQREYSMRNSSIWALIKRNGMKNHLERRLRTISCSYKDFLWIINESCFIWCNQKEFEECFSVLEKLKWLFWCVFYGCFKHERERLLVVWNEITFDDFNVSHLLKWFFSSSLLCKAITTKYLNTDAESCPGVQQSKVHDKQKQQKDM